MKHSQDKWMDEMERISSLTQNAVKETCIELPITVLYINHKNELENQVQDTIVLHFTLDTSGNHQKTFATKEVLLKKMCMYKKCGLQSRFVCKELLLYHVPIEPEQIQPFSQSNDDTLKQLYSSKFLKSFPVTDSIEIEPSIFIFHQINQLYFVFHEIPSLKSCLKTSDNNNQNQNQNQNQKNNNKYGTKKVRLKIHRHTRRHF